MTRRINLERWQPHVEEARRRGVSLKAYAAQEGVSLYSLYRASQVLRQGAAVRPAKATGGKFAAVRVVAAPTPVLLRVAAHLPNGVSLQVDARGSEVAAVIAALGALPCSA
ncbi:MAG TPA: hypothetical protein VMI92_03020 [Steroidobacteraceae bacterium]|nr:hypothetical protein [Steroidobacteraceae bacterium]